MSNIGGIGSSGSIGEVYSPTAPSAPTTPAGSGEDQTLLALQKLVSQIEGAANTKAIPAHQSW